MKKVILAPHLDDEIVGCYSILDEDCVVVYWHEDYRTPPDIGVEFVRFDGNSEEVERIIEDAAEVYIPSKHDYHPLHKEVNAWAEQNIPEEGCIKYWYSVEMNVPWLQEEEDPEGKQLFLKAHYPDEHTTLNKSDKYWLFKSIQPYDDIIWGSVKMEREMLHCWPGAPEEVSFLRHPHRHIFKISVDIQQFGDDRDVQYFMLRNRIQPFIDKEWPLHTSCEMMAKAIKKEVRRRYPGRLVRVSVFEDGENGAILE